MYLMIWEYEYEVAKQLNLRCCFNKDTELTQVKKPAALTDSEDASVIASGGAAPVKASRGTAVTASRSAAVTASGGAASVTAVTASGSPGDLTATTTTVDCHSDIQGTGYTVYIHNIIYIYIYKHIQYTYTV